VSIINQSYGLPFVWTPRRHLVRTRRTLREFLAHYMALPFRDPSTGLPWTRGGSILNDENGDSCCCETCSVVALVSFDVTECPDVSNTSGFPCPFECANTGSSSGTFCLTCCPGPNNTWCYSSAGGIDTNCPGAPASFDGWNITLSRVSAGSGGGCTAGTTAWRLVALWNTVSGSVNGPNVFFCDPSGASFGGACTADIRSGGMPVAGDSYTLANAFPLASCACHDYAIFATGWGYGGTATVTFADAPCT
jgi:hypothetical protein